MSAGARTRGRRHLNLADLEEGTATRPEIRAYGETATGVHGLPLEQALERFELCRAVENPADTQVPLIWIDISAPGPEEEVFLRERLRFHPLAVEDCVRGRQRPKLDRYPGYYFLVFYAAAINEERERMALHEVHVFIGRRYLVTVHDHVVTPFQEVLARWRAQPENFRTVGALAHGVVDSIVDGYFPVLDHFAERVDEVEERIYESKGDADIGGILAMRRELTTLRRVVLPRVLPGLAAGATLAFVAALGEFVASILLYTHRTRPIAVEMLSQLRAFDFGGAAAYGVLLIALVAVAFAFGYRGIEGGSG